MQIEGKKYLSEIIKLLKKAYTKAEITASVAGGAPSVAPVRQKALKTAYCASARVPGSSKTLTTPDPNGSRAALPPRGSRLKKKKFWSSTLPGKAAAAPDQRSGASSASF